MFSVGVCRDWRTSWYAVSNWQWMWSGMESGSLHNYDTDRPAFLERDLVGLNFFLLFALGILKFRRRVSLHPVYSSYSSILASSTRESGLK